MIQVCFKGKKTTTKAGRSARRGENQPLQSQKLAGGEDARFLSDEREFGQHGKVGVNGCQRARSGENQPLRSKKLARGEDGRITLLMVALTFLVGALICLAVVTTSLHMQRSRAQSYADQAALAAVTSDMGPYYRAIGNAGAEKHMSDKVRDLLQTLKRSGAIDSSARLVDLSFNGKVVQLRIATNLNIPLVSGIFGSHVTALVDSSARKV